MKHQTVDMAMLLSEVNNIDRSKSEMNKGDLALLIYNGMGHSDSYCKYRLSQIAHGKTPMTMKDLGAFQVATGLPFNTILSFITIPIEQTSTNHSTTNEKGKHNNGRKAILRNGGRGKKGNTTVANN